MKRVSSQGQAAPVQEMEREPTVEDIAHEEMNAQQVIAPLVFRQRRYFRQSDAPTNSTDDEPPFRYTGGTISSHSPQSIVISQMLLLKRTKCPDPLPRSYPNERKIPSPVLRSGGGIREHSLERSGEAEGRNPMKQSARLNKALRTRRF